MKPLGTIVASLTLLAVLLAPAIAQKQTGSPSPGPEDEMMARMMTMMGQMKGSMERMHAMMQQHHAQMRERCAGAMTPAAPKKSE
jgi:hypothetical protein